MTELMPSLCNDCVARNQCGNDDVKMCISYTKETKIKCDDCKFVEDCVDYGWKDCKKFTPKPSEPMTNEEYIQTCNTEQLAEAIYYLTWFHTELDERLDKNVKNGCYNDDENIKIVTEWLKQPHHSD